MITLFAPIIALLILLVVVEAATIATLGKPVLRDEDSAKLRKLLPLASLNHCDKKMLSFWPEKGYISPCGFSLFGTLYYSDYSRNIRIPWWTPLYKEVKAKYAELNAQEKG